MPQRLLLPQPQTSLPMCLHLSRGCGFLARPNHEAARLKLRTTQEGFIDPWQDTAKIGTI
jgi:hypothetical protein